MLVQPSKISGMYFIDPKVFADARGHFYEVFQTKRFREHGLPDAFVQDNHSRSARGTVCGLHYQIRHPQGKLLRVVRGSIFDVAVDLRNGSPTFGRSVTVELSEENRRQVYIPPGCAHGFCALREDTELVYKCTDLYYPEYECTLLWNDPALKSTGRSKIRCYPRRTAAACLCRKRPTMILRSRMPCPPIQIPSRVVSR